MELPFLFLSSSFFHPLPTFIENEDYLRDLLASPSLETSLTLGQNPMNPYPETRSTYDHLIGWRLLLEQYGRTGLGGIDWLPHSSIASQPTESIPVPNVFQKDMYHKKHQTIYHDFVTL
ncbi:hypothetical protein OSB04_022553 [Centaurea solstitialis]|uniref:Uncharacterized protein n=1 Tax=Centaurea solstitialis TaxID=347529 RepID=A0AA38WF96_9ASTR|nr:hypothetical protein OSB04_022553 [Centaurea solstitialis]